MKINMNDIVHPKYNYLGLRILEENPLLTESMRVEGLQNPITIVQDLEKYTIVSGCLRYLSAEKLGWEEIECIIFDPITLSYRR